MKGPLTFALLILALGYACPTDYKEKTIRIGFAIETLKEEL